MKLNKLNQLKIFENLKNNFFKHYCSCYKKNFKKKKIDKIFKKN